MTIREMRSLVGDTQLESRVKSDLINHKTVRLPLYDRKKLDLPKRKDYIGSFVWLKAVQECFGESIVFALDEALMCYGSFLGRSDEFVVWIYGNDSLSRYNGVVVLGNQIDSHDVKEREGVRYTDFNRTIADALTNESILDMQGITEALSKYYYSHKNSFEGIFTSPEHRNAFAKLAEEAIEYYDG